MGHHGYFHEQLECILIPLVRTLQSTCKVIPISSKFSSLVGKNSIRKEFSLLHTCSHYHYLHTPRDKNYSRYFTFISTLVGMDERHVLDRRCRQNVFRRSTVRVFWKNGLSRFFAGKLREGSPQCRPRIAAGLPSRTGRGFGCLIVWLPEIFIPYI